jgi:hypothetical protein
MARAARTFPCTIPTLDDYGRHFDLGVHVGAVADHQRVGALDLAAEAAVDADATFELQFSFEMRAAAEQRGDFGRGEGRRHGGTIAKKKRRE